MMNKKKVMTGCALALALSAATMTSFAAAAYKTPAEAVSGFTGKTLDEVTAERKSGKSYGSIASEAGKLREFQQAVSDIHEDRLNEAVADGTLTREQADAQLAAIRERQAACDGNGSGDNTGTGCGAGGCNGTGMGYHHRGNGYGLGGYRNN
ncbi:hypothetical protein [Lacrimispora defluvii]|uniref:DUF2680 domain-containing protein n=1 Tax=Lacrimispora defluvii TaxID=2719233 RepID=A0ABX1VRR5_9FIRM|nr:hypothetical protein [Lacrimispora defluvii]NNJ29976.1 hypothetical protein [Lacrimispora defluvii]